MRRRDILLVGAGVTLAKLTASSLACANTVAPPATAATPGAGATPADASAVAALSTALSTCRLTGDRCIALCLHDFKAGDTMMAECAERTTVMLAICDAMARVVALRSELARPLAQTCKQACSECAAACKPHIEHHAECKACFDACVATQQALERSFA